MEVTMETTIISGQEARSFLVRHSAGGALRLPWENNLGGTSGGEHTLLLTSSFQAGLFSCLVGYSFLKKQIETNKALKGGGVWYSIIKVLVPIKNIPN
jgi:hypothetical protein